MTRELRTRRGVFHVNVADDATEAELDAVCNLVAGAIQSERGAVIVTGPNVTIERRIDE